MSEETPQLSPYPFAIAPVHCPDNKASTLNVWNVQEFFRIELLLRSHTVQMIYRLGAAGPKSTLVLGLIYGMTWDVLQGSHHRYLQASSGGVDTIPGFAMMTYHELSSRLETLHQFSIQLPGDSRPKSVRIFKPGFSVC
jgi:hypothetical protein